MTLLFTMTACTLQLVRRLTMITNKIQGKVFIYSLIAGVFTLLQELRSPNDERAEKFGWRLQYSDNKLHITPKTQIVYKKQHLMVQKQAILFPDSV